MGATVILGPPGEGNFATVKEKIAIERALEGLRPKPFSCQLSGLYCQTEVYKIATWDKKHFRRTVSKSRAEEKVYSCMQGIKDGNNINWFVWDVNPEKEWQTVPHDSREDALADLKSRDRAMAHNSISDRHLSERVVSIEELGINHYEAFSAWQNISLEGNGSIKMQGAHAVENTVCLLSKFNDKAPKTSFNTEDYITEMIHFLASMRLGEFVERGGDINMDAILVGDQLEAMFQNLQNQHKNIEALKVDNSIRKIQEIKKIENKIKADISDIFLSPGNFTKYGYFFMAELETLQIQSQCDWSKVPDVCSLVQTKYENFRKTYEDHLNKERPRPPKMP